MLIAARYLLDRLRQPRTRADEVLAIRRQLASQPGANRVTARERELARHMLELRNQIATALSNLPGQGAVACASCAQGCPAPEGRFAGGYCCSNRTEILFTADEIAALALSGTRPSSLTQPAGDHAGCAFRGPTGCSLEPSHRPNVCIGYLCGELRADLADRDALAAILETVDELEAAFTEFTTARKARLEYEELAAIHPLLAGDAPI